MTLVADTIAVDTSALIAMFLQEDGLVDYGRYLNTCLCLIGTPTLVEFQMVMVSRVGGGGCREAIAYLERQPNLRFVAFDAEHQRLAAAAFLQFGKGRHPAGLNYGDCLTYAVAKAARVPLLFKGNDFSRTDLVSAVPDAV